MGEQFALTEQSLPGQARNAATAGISNKRGARNPPPNLNYDRLADLVSNAIRGTGSSLFSFDKEGVYAALQELNQDQAAVDELRRVYMQRYRLDLFKDIDDHFGGDAREFARQLVRRGSGSSDQRIDPARPPNLQQAAARIRDAVEGWGTNEEAVYAALIPLERNPQLLAELRKIYQAAYNESLTERLWSEFSGSERDYVAFLYLDVDTAYEYYIKVAGDTLCLAVRGGRCVSSKGIYASDHHFDRSYWEAGNPRNAQGEAAMMAIKTLSGKWPSQAIRTMYESISGSAVEYALGSTWHLDCAEWVQAHHVFATWKVLGAYRLDEYFSGREFWFRNHCSSGLKTSWIYGRDKCDAPMTSINTINGEPEDPPSFDLHSTQDPEALLSATPIGSRVAFINLAARYPEVLGRIPTEDETDWATENTIKIGADLYCAHGGWLSTHFSARGVIEMSLGHAKDPRIDDEANARQTCFLGEIQVYRCLAREPWTKWFFKGTPLPDPYSKPPP